MQDNTNNSVLNRAISKAGWRLVPVLILMYMLSYLDRANIGFAKQGFNRWRHRVFQHLIDEVDNPGVVFPVLHEGQKLCWTNVGHAGNSPLRSEPNACGKMTLVPNQND